MKQKSFINQVLDHVELQFGERAFQKKISYTRKLFSINRKKGEATNPNNSFFSEKKKELLGWDSNP